MHALNAVFALFELLFTRTERPPWIQIPFLVLLLAGYLGVAFITYADQGFFTYGFLDFNKNSSGSVAAYVFGILAGMIVVFLIVTAIIWARNLLFERVFGKDEKYYLRDKGMRSGRRYENGAV